MGDEQQGGAPVQGGDQQAQILKQIQDAVKTQTQPKTSVSAPRMNPAMGKMGLGQDIGTSLLKMLVPTIGGAVQRSIKAKKEQQINEAVNDYTILHNAYEEAQIATQGDKQKAEEQFNKDPRVQAIMGDKKKQKLIAKAFSVDLTNPGKSQETAHFQGFKRFADLKQASGQMKSVQAMMKQVQGAVPPTSPAGQPQGGGAAEKFGGAQSPQQQQESPQAKPAGGLPTETKLPDMKTLEEASTTMKNVMEASHIDEPKNEFQAWYRAKKDEQGQVSSADVEAHHESMRLKPVDQVIADGLALAEQGDMKGAQEKFDLAKQASSAIRPDKTDNYFSLVHKANSGSAEQKASAKQDLAVYRADQEAFREAYGRGRAKYMFASYQMPDGTIKPISGYDMFLMGRSGEPLPIPSGRLTTEQIIPLQQLQKEAGPKGSPEYAKGALKGIYDNIDAFDNAKDRAIFAKAWSDARHTSDWIETMNNVLNQIALDKLSPEGQKLYQADRRLAEIMGLFRARMKLPSTDASMSLGLALMPGAQTPNSEFAKSQLDQLDAMIKNAWVPALGQAPKSTTPPKKKAMDF